MTIYVEYAVFDNLVINAILLWFTFRTVKNRVAVWKILFCGVIGVAFAIFVPVVAGICLTLFKVKNNAAAMITLMTLKILVSVMFLGCLSVLIRILNVRGKIENHIKNIEIKIKDKTFKARGFMDTGNQLVDPKSKLPVCVISHELYVKILPNNGYYIPVNTINKTGKMLVFRAKVDEREVCLGVTNKTFSHYDILLNANI